MAASDANRAGHLGPRFRLVSIAIGQICSQHTEVYQAQWVGEGGLGPLLIHGNALLLPHFSSRLERIEAVAARSSDPLAPRSRA